MNILLNRRSLEGQKKARELEGADESRQAKSGLIHHLIFTNQGKRVPGIGLQKNINNRTRIFRSVLKFKTQKYLAD